MGQILILFVIFLSFYAFYDLHRSWKIGQRDLKRNLEMIDMNSIKPLSQLVYRKRYDNKFDKHV